MDLSLQSREKMRICLKSFESEFWESDLKVRVSRADLSGVSNIQCGLKSFCGVEFRFERRVDEG